MFDSKVHFSFSSICLTRKLFAHHMEEGSGNRTPPPASGGANGFAARGKRQLLSLLDKLLKHKGSPPRR